MNVRRTFGVWIALTVGIAIGIAGCDSPTAQQKPAEAAPEAAAPPPLAAPIPAGVGVGKKGRSLDDVDGVGGIIAQPARTLFATKERVVFEIQIPHATQLYTAQNGKPKSHEQFMSGVIEFNKIKLPELPAGRQYRFDVETQTLMVENAK